MTRGEVALRIARRQHLVAEALGGAGLTTRSASELTGLSYATIQKWRRLPHVREWIAEALARRHSPTGTAPKLVTAAGRLRPGAGQERAPDGSVPAETGVAPPPAR